ncbi:MAG: serine hydrolase [Flavobacteriales bacterium]|nr:serine hydrolase [Flavobacteriales bacterium]
MHKNTLSVVSLAAAAVIGGAISYWLIGRNGSGDVTRATAPAVPGKRAPDCAYDIVRASGFKRVRPLLFSEPLCESPRFDALRGSIGTAVDAMKASGKVSSASVYLRDFHKAEWTWYNGDEEFDPGSLLKVPLMLAWLSKNEQEAGALDRTFVCDERDRGTLNTSAFPSDQAQPGRSYTVRQLLELSIVHSDNRATSVLLRHMAPSKYISTFTELGLEAPVMEAKAYRMNVREYSVFMKALYNSSLLSPLDSEYAVELMTRAKFDKGLVAGLPAGIDIAHKFGESGNAQEKQLHETGLVYVSGNAYLITVMTRGSDVDSLAGAIASLSKLVYERMLTP